LKNLVFCAIGYKDNYGNSVNINLDGFRATEIYLKNTFVALKSIQTQNNNDDVAVVVNFIIPEYYMKLFEANNIKTYFCEFDDFKFPPNFKWALAFYKLCAYKFVIENLEYDNYLELDCDVVCNGDLSEMWSEI